MKKRLISFITGLTIAASLAAPSLAARKPMVVGDPVVQAAGPCVADEENFQTGFSTSESAYNKGVYGYIDLPGGTTFDNCGDIGYPSAASAWLGITGTGVYGSGAIIQIGIIQCDSISFPTFCVGSNPHFAGSWTGCLPGSVTVDFGEADLGRHHYRLSQAQSNGDWYFYVDNVLKKVLSTSDPMIYCWDNLATRAEFFVEKHNRADDTGNIANNYVLFDTLKHYRSNVNEWWAEVGTACAKEPATGYGSQFCSHDQDSMLIFTNPD